MSCPRDTKGDKQSKHGKKKDENRKSKGRKDKINDSNSHGNHEVDPPAGSDLEMDSRLLSALLTVCLHSTYLHSTVFASSCYVLTV